ncbi:2-hydroxymuconate tautomerase [Phycicoccus sp. Soil748]|uniref:2-hydroxymuconate tautomerase n=1 Tax=Intrasporangiaceae TaxID=85021 RepID=UPI0007029E64|nr:2-hydroxymuconate tautomerase [Phycicoccus sp. Soil748]KRE55435.1 4-oxalocrotonate tautomerase [Phycicoccus sp. Soil748]
MPLVEVTMVEGRTPEQVRALVSALTRAVVETVDAPLENVRVVVREVPATHWAAGDVTIAERRAASAHDTSPDLGKEAP